MHRVCIALVDATRARFFTLDRSADGTGELEQLAEPSHLIQPAPEGHQRARRESEFARTAMAAFREVIDEYAPERAIVCADAGMLPKLRAAAPGLLPDELALDALACDFVTSPPAEIRAQLAARGLLPPRHVRSTLTEPLVK